MNRREFLRLGMLGTTGALLGWEGLAEAAQQTAGGPFTFPAPVYRTLGRTGLKITIVSFGAMLTPEPEVIRVAFEHGVNYVDTARRYMNGRNEEIVARALKGMHDKVYVATKIISSSRSKEDIVRDVETSLKALERDHIDVIQLHNVTGRERLFEPEMREALVKLKQQGKVRFFGVTTHTNETEVVNAIVDDKDKFFDTILVKYNFKSGDDLRKAVARAAQSGIGVIAMKTQAGGYTTDALGPISPHQAALKWALQDKSITAAIPGMRDMGHLREDIAVMGMRMTIADSLILRYYGAAVASQYCHMCGKCEETCPRGVQISVVNRSLMYAEAYRSAELARDTYGEIPSSASASACIKCGHCTARCVNGLDIAAKMNRAKQLLA
jgi:predicted aldo/keto reductase-like oxidoreductase